MVGKILIAEDEPDNLEILRSVVEDIGGFRALLASDGEEALRLAESEIPDIVLIDLLLPRLSGFDVARRLRLNPATERIPIIAISALGRVQDRVEAIAAGATEYLDKPFDLDDLLQRVRSLLAGASSSDQGMGRGL